FFGVTLQTDCDFRHASPFDDPRWSVASCQLLARGRPVCLTTDNGHLTLNIMQPEFGKMQHRASRCEPCGSSTRQQPISLWEFILRRSIVELFNKFRTIGRDWPLESSGSQRAD